MTLIIDKAAMKIYTSQTILTLFVITSIFLTGSISLATTQPYVSSHGVNFGSGNKYQVETDFSITSPANTLTFKRTYNSHSKSSGVVGHGWIISYGEQIIIKDDRITLIQTGGRHVHFIDNEDGTWTNQTGKLRTITQTANGYQLVEPSGTVKTFDAEGKILSKQGRNNTGFIYTYTGSLLSTVAETFGKPIAFNYTNGKITSLDTSTGTFTYSYDGNNNLVSVIKPDGTSRQYLYEDPNDINNLTGIIDESGNQIMTIAYNDKDRVTSVAKGDDTYTFEYLPDRQRKVTDSRGVSSTYTLEANHGLIRVKSFTGPGCSACGSDTGSSYVYNDRNQVEQKTGAKGNVTTYQYDSKGNRTVRTEAVGADEERTISWTYDPATNKIATLTKESVSNPSGQQTDSMSYDTNGNLIGKTETGYSGNTAISRTTSYTYDEYGRIRTIDGPRTDVNDVTTFAYYPNTEDQGLNRGFLQSVTNPLGHVTGYANYNGFGKPELVSSPNGTSQTVYDASGRVTSRNSNGIVQSYFYDSSGQLTRISLPGNRHVLYAYDSSGRVHSITDNQNNSIAYVYDSKGNKIKESVNDPSGVLTRFIDYTYEQTGELDKTILADGSTMDLNYDTVGNLVQRINGDVNITSYVYDALNRLSSMVEPGDVLTSYAYDSDDNLTAVTDANGNTTSFVFDDFGRKISRISPDTGQTIYSYDAAGNLTAKTDANNITVTYEYDTLNRLLAVRYPDSSLDITYTYDLWENGKGKLSIMKDATGETSYLYDEHGRLAVEKRTAGELSWSFDYWYNENSELISIVYPSGRTINYQRDAIGRIFSITSTFEGVTETLAHNVDYLPFGPLTGMSLGNGLDMSNSYDQVYRLTNSTVGTLYNRTYQYTATGLVESIVDNVAPGASQSFQYDSLHRLIGAQGKYGSLNYSYDNVGNRLSGNGMSYAYAEGSNRLAEVNGVQSISYGYDAAGNISSKGGNGFTYNDANRIAAAEKQGQVVGEYGYDGNNLRSVKTVNGKSVYSLYGMGGNLLAEYDSTGKVLKEYVYGDGQRLALFAYKHVGGTGRGNEGQPAGQEARPVDKKTPPGKTKTPPGQDKKGDHLASLPNLPDKILEIALPYYQPFTYYFISDHLGTGQMVVDSAAQVVWQADYQPFGQVDIVVDNLDNNLRFPGQYFDAETGLHYNWNRYYDPETGRYISADPIGLEGGMNLYAYVGGDPISYSDPMGLYRGDEFDDLSPPFDDLDSADEERCNEGCDKETSRCVVFCASIGATSYCEKWTRCANGEWVQKGFGFFHIYNRWENNQPEILPFVLTCEQFDLYSGKNT